jgi:hypothetical protein
MSSCEGNTCSTACPAESSAECCPVEKSLQSSCCPVESAQELWNKAFFRAMHEAHTDILKEKIRKAWGPQLDKIADATVEAMGVAWHSMLTQAKAQEGLRDAIQKAYESGAKK